MMFVDLGFDSTTTSTLCSLAMLEECWIGALHSDACRGGHDSVFHLVFFFGKQFTNNRNSQNRFCQRSEACLLSFCLEISAVTL